MSMERDESASVICPSCKGRGFDPAGSVAAERNPDPARTCSTCKGAGAIDEGWHKVLTTPVVFGLRAQVHIPTIERMLGEGASWPEIGDAIGWCPDTAREWYERDQKVNS